MNDLELVYGQLDEEIADARDEIVEAETRLKVANAVFDRLMRLKPRIQGRIRKMRGPEDVYGGPSDDAKGEA